MWLEYHHTTHSIFLVIIVHEPIPLSVHPPIHPFTYLFLHLQYCPFNICMACMVVPNTTPGGTGQGTLLLPPRNVLPNHIKDAPFLPSLLQKHSQNASLQDSLSLSNLVWLPIQLIPNFLLFLVQHSCLLFPPKRYINLIYYYVYAICIHITVMHPSICLSTYIIYIIYIH